MTVEVLGMVYSGSTLAVFTYPELLMPTSSLYEGNHQQECHRSTILCNDAFMPVWCYNLDCLLYTPNESCPAQY
ncbi:hypothetical protein EYC84_003774 [Monilinia fructicola]|uniref:Uncharacterized protein n=1 Tax=Monilinia fructicola TaxID=38448 RepID=A0A5M9JXR7_MONFR|nr:hypothetical protein EYC84_003774 [Monilinia fructicola]